MNTFHVTTSILIFVLRAGNELNIPLRLFLSLGSMSCPVWFIPAWVRRVSAEGLHNCACADPCWRSFSAGMKCCGQVCNNLGLYTIICFMLSLCNTGHCGATRIPVLLMFSCGLETLQERFLRLFYEGCSSLYCTCVHLHKRMWKWLILEFTSHWLKEVVSTFIS